MYRDLGHLGVAIRHHSLRRYHGPRVRRPERRLVCLWIHCRQLLRASGRRPSPRLEKGRCGRPGAQRLDERATVAQGFLLGASRRSSRRSVGYYFRPQQCATRFWRNQRERYCHNISRSRALTTSNWRYMPWLVRMRWSITNKQRNHREEKKEGL